ncbi:MAG: DMT family transporter [Desulfobacteraceae bacterium]|nr:DMT family transporter [Desulfobacteraceae bacterium]
MKNRFLYIVTVLIWGSTWIAIKYQLGSVDPLISTFYRFALAALILMLFCYVRGLNMRFSIKDHMFLALFGFLLFSVSYWMVYMAEIYITSGVVAVTFSAIVFMNIINGAIFLKKPINSQMVAGAFIGIIGIGFIFFPEIKSFDFSDKSVQGLGMCFLSVLMASLGNIVSARNSENGLPVVQANAFGMAYGAIVMLLIAILIGKEFTISFSTSYLTSLFYLAIFGSILGFGSYLTLIGEIGADKASYAIMLVPVVALIISSFCEGYVWNLPSVFGLTLVLIGNFMALRKKYLPEIAVAKDRGLI